MVDNYMKHEALDRTHIAVEIVSNMLDGHEGAKLVPSAYDKVQQAINLLAEAYQEYGAAFLGDKKEGE